MEETKPFTISLWFDAHVEEVMHYYCSIFKDSQPGSVTYYGPNMPMPEGTPLTATFKLNGWDFLALNGGPMFKPNEAMALMVFCKDQEEVDYYWNALTADGGQESQCGWLKDKYGFSWQIIPSEWVEMMSSPDRAAVNRAMGAMMQMRKLDLAVLKKAYQGE